MRSYERSENVLYLDYIPYKCSIYGYPILDWIRKIYIIYNMAIQKFSCKRKSFRLRKSFKTQSKTVFTMILTFTRTVYCESFT